MKGAKKYLLPKRYPEVVLNDVKTLVTVLIVVILGRVIECTEQSCCCPSKHIGELWTCFQQNADKRILLLDCLLLSHLRWLYFNVTI